MSAAYADRFADALRARIPGPYHQGVDVVNSQGMVVLARGTARVVVRQGLVTDRRGPVHDDAVTDALKAAARHLRGEVPKYREEFRALSLELADILHRATL